MTTNLVGFPHHQVNLLEAFQKALGRGPGRGPPFSYLNAGHRQPRGKRPPSDEKRQALNLHPPPTSRALSHLRRQGHVRRISFPCPTHSPGSREYSQRLTGCQVHRQQEQNGRLLLAMPPIEHSVRAHLPVIAGILVPRRTRSWPRSHSLNCRTSPAHASTAASALLSAKSMSLCSIRGQSWGGP